MPGDNTEITDRGDLLPEDIEAQRVADDAAKAESGKQAEADLAAVKAAEDAAKAEAETSAKAEADKQGEEQTRNEKGQFEARIPKARFDEAVGKEREARLEAERKLAEAQAQLRARETEQSQLAKTEDAEKHIDALTERHADLLLDGNKEEAAKVMREIRRAERELAAQELEPRAVARLTAAMENERLNVAIAQLKVAYPQLNEESERYDDDITEFVLAKHAKLVQQGMPPSQALQKAAEEVMARFAEKEREAEPSKGLDVAKGGEKIDPVKARAEEQVKKNLEAAARQPSSLKHTGLDSDKAGETGQLPDPSKLTQEEFDKLPESTKQRMRGDTI